MHTGNIWHICRGKLAACVTVALSGLAATAIAVPPHPSLLDRWAAGEAQLPYFITHLDELHEKGICTGHSIRLGRDGRTLALVKRSPAYTGQFRALAVLVDFTDHASSVAATFFDSLLFDTVGNTVHTYYDEISYGQLDLVTVDLPSSMGWQTAPETYAYYVNDEHGTGDYPQNTQKLTEDLVDQVDSLVDFSNYDNDDDGYVDILIIVHSGSGAEYSGYSYDIWSHKWGITPRLKDGVYVSDYTIQPELWSSAGDMTIGVYAHELGHGFGLPDLYDTDGSSYGIGKWGLMAYGSWNGPTGFGESPAHPSAWSRIRMGFTSPVIVSGNTYSQAIGEVENGGAIFRLWSSGSVEDEYFLVENRQKTGYDSWIPSTGLLVWHVDDAKSGNTQEWWPGLPDESHYLVALEQADGLWDVENKRDRGDAGDPFPGANNVTTFDATTTPSSDSYTAGTSFVKIDNVSASGATMYADLIVAFAAGSNDDDTKPLVPVSIELDQNYPNPFNPQTTICFTSSATTAATLEVYNIVGQKVATLFEGLVSPGMTTVSWDGLDPYGQAAASGVYLYRLVAGDAEQAKKMILLR